MKKDKYKTDVVFRVLTIGDITEVTAFFPHNVETMEGHVGCYTHCGQHGAADYRYCVSKSRLATKAEYADLKKELETGFGYNFNIIKKQNREKYLKSLMRVQSF